MAKKEFEIYSIDEDTYKIVSLVNNEELTFKKNVEKSRSFIYNKSVWEFNEGGSIWIHLLITF